MTTTDSSFIADGIPTGIGPRATIGFYAKAQTRRPSALSGPFTVGTFAVGNLVGVYGATDGTQPTPGVHWFEDFGAAKLKRGRAVVKLDTNFAKVIKRGDYKVFVSAEGDCRGLYVRKSAASFEVREFGGGTSSVAFSYRIIGRRKDIRGHRRFAKIDVTLPAFPRRRKPLARSRKGAGATPARGRRRRRDKRA